MADDYWGRQKKQQQPHYPSAPAYKRSRSDYDLQPGAAPGQESYQYLPRDDNRAVQTLKDTKYIEESYERYLQNAQRPSFGRGEASNFSATEAGYRIGGAMQAGAHSRPYWDSVMVGGPDPRAVVPDLVANERGVGFGVEFSMDRLVQKKPFELRLPPDATNTIFVEGLPHDITVREIAHIFRPFLGYKESRKVTKEPKYHSADPVVLCFVDFTDSGCALVAITALQENFRSKERDLNIMFIYAYLKEMTSSSNKYDQFGGLELATKKTVRENRPLSKEAMLGLMEIKGFFVMMKRDEVGLFA